MVSLKFPGERTCRSIVAVLVWITDEGKIKTQDAGEIKLSYIIKQLVSGVVVHSQAPCLEKLKRGGAVAQHSGSGFNCQYCNLSVNQS